MPRWLPIKSHIVVNYSFVIILIFRLFGEQLVALNECGRLGQRLIKFQNENKRRNRFVVFQQHTQFYT